MSVRLHLKIKLMVRSLNKRRLSRGITPIIATVLILALVVAGVVIGFVQIMPYIERSKVETDAASIQSSLIKIDNVIWDMISDSAGSYLPDSVPSRQLQITIPIGSLSTLSTRNNVTFQPIYYTPSNSTLPATFNRTLSTFSTGTYGVLSHTFSSNYVLLPENTLEYLTGSNPYQRRSAVSVSDLTSSISDDQSATNISLYRIGTTHYMDLSYRPKIFISQTIENGNPTENVNIFLIKLIGSTTFIGTTNVFIKYEGASVNQTTKIGHAGDSFEILMSAGTSTDVYAPFSAAPGGFTSFYKVTVTVQTFSISG